MDAFQTGKKCQNAETKREKATEKGTRPGAMRQNDSLQQNPQKALQIWPKTAKNAPGVETSRREIGDTEIFTPHGNIRETLVLEYYTNH